MCVQMHLSILGFDLTVKFEHHNIITYAYQLVYFKYQ